MDGPVSVSATLSTTAVAAAETARPGGGAGGFPLEVAGFGPIAGSHDRASASNQTPAEEEVWKTAARMAAAAIRSAAGTSAERAGVRATSGDHSVVPKLEPPNLRASLVSSGCVVVQSKDLTGPFRV